MNISRAIDQIAYPGPSALARLGRAGAAFRDRLAAAVAAYRASRAAERAGRMPLDARTLRDIGITPQGLREAALAAGNEGRMRAARR